MAAIPICVNGRCYNSVTDTHKSRFLAQDEVPEKSA